jgi:F-type H+-transporting ATPase subunit b
MNNLYNIFSGISEGSFGINTDIFETNIINLVIFVGFVFVVLSKNLSETLNTRQQKVISSIQEAEDRLQRSKTRLEEARKQLDQINLIVDDIKTEAVTAGATLQTNILVQGTEEIERLSENAKLTIKNTEVQVKRQILQQITSLTIQRARAQFKELLSYEMQEAIIDKGIADLGV